jgi:hypothetical protein
MVSALIKKIGSIIKEKFYNKVQEKNIQIMGIDTYVKKRKIIFSCIIANLLNNRTIEKLDQWLNLCIAHLVKIS